MFYFYHNNSKVINAVFLLSFYLLDLSFSILPSSEESFFISILLTSVFTKSFFFFPGKRKFFTSDIYSLIPEQVDGWRCLFFIYGETKIRQLELLRAPQIRVVPRAPPLGFVSTMGLCMFGCYQLCPFYLCSPPYSPWANTSTLAVPTLSVPDVLLLVLLQSPTPATCKISFCWQCLWPLLSNCSMCLVS